tara:strand:+ start:2473 stop:3390 length:918 start_codon:yes stop_codon:yes gene_type:complete
MVDKWVEISQFINQKFGREATICDYKIGLLTTYRTIGRCSLFLKVDNKRELEHALDICRQKDIEVAVIGNGSNLLISDNGFEGLIIKLGSDFKEVKIMEEHAYVGGAAKLPVVARSTSSKGLTGFEWAVGVPGTIGGAVKMNAGGHGSDMKASIESVDVLDTRTSLTKTLNPNDLLFGYRESSISKNQLVTNAVLKLSEGNPEESSEVIREIVRWRLENQPGGQNAGSVFTNPEGQSAGRLIEDSGCKGMRVGSAEVSIKHANFIQADVGGKAQDIRDLMELISESVYSKFGILLTAETEMIGFD